MSKMTRMIQLVQGGANRSVIKNELGDKVAAMLLCELRHVARYFDGYPIYPEFDDEDNALFILAADARVREPKPKKDPRPRLIEQIAKLKAAENTPLNAAKLALAEAKLAEAEITWNEEV